MEQNSNPQREQRTLARFLAGHTGPRSRRPNAAGRVLWDLWAQTMRSLNISSDRLSSAIDTYIKAIEAKNKHLPESARIKPFFKGNILPELLGSSALTLKSVLRAWHIVGIVRVEFNVKLITFNRQEINVSTSLDLQNIKATDDE
jgi:hypothetical protein